MSIVSNEIPMKALFVFPLIWVIAIGEFTIAQPIESVSDTNVSTIQFRIERRDFPSVFQAWNPIDMQAWPQDSPADRLRAVVKHDLIWEEPISQRGYGVPLVLGAIWDHQHGGVATRFTSESENQARAARAQMLQINPDMVFLLEVRWRDAPGSFLPENSPLWKRDADGSRAKGWAGGPEPYYLLDAADQSFQENVARQCVLAIESGIYDGIMLDWNGQFDLVKRIREAIGSSALIIVNIHDDISDAKMYGDLINGSFMECNPQGPGEANVLFKTDWSMMREALIYFEKTFRSPQVNCLEVWGDRNDLRRMRAATTLGLVYSNGSVLFADPNPLKTPDHLHDWYTFWDVELGRPIDGFADPTDGIAKRGFEGGLVAYNHFGNGTIRFELPSVHRRVSDGATGTQFELQDADGDIFIPVAK
jgi:hypothetical protein